MSGPNRLLESSIVLAVLGFAVQVPTSAQSAPVDAARAACNAELQQFCAGVQPGGGRMLACLKEHRDQVSPACRSEEHTSELQSRENLVCRLLLEKKKKTK